MDYCTAFLDKINQTFDEPASGLVKYLNILLEVLEALLQAASLFFDSRSAGRHLPLKDNTWYSGMEASTTVSSFLSFFKVFMRTS